jgi:hypothetical protein
MEAHAIKGESSVMCFSNAKTFGGDRLYTPGYAFFYFYAATTKARILLGKTQDTFAWIVRVRTA